MPFKLANLILFKLFLLVSVSAEVESNSTSIFDKELETYESKRADLSSLNWQGFSTLVPKSAILHLPEHFKSRFKTSYQGTQLLPLNEFLLKNKNWLKIIELNDNQIRGKEALNLEHLEQLKKTGTVIITTYQNSVVGLGPDILKKVLTPKD